MFAFAPMNEAADGRPKRSYDLIAVLKALVEGLRARPKHEHGYEDNNVSRRNCESGLLETIAISPKCVKPY